MFTYTNIRLVLLCFLSNKEDTLSWMIIKLLANESYQHAHNPYKHDLAFYVFVLNETPTARMQQQEIRYKKKYFIQKQQAI
jgi:hypothetical protein